MDIFKFVGFFEEQEYGVIEIKRKFLTDNVKYRTRKYIRTQLKAYLLKNKNVRFETYYTKIPKRSKIIVIFCVH